MMMMRSFVQIQFRSECTLHYILFHLLWTRYKYHSIVFPKKKRLLRVWHSQHFIISILDNLLDFLVDWTNDWQLHNQNSDKTGNHFTNLLSMQSIPKWHSLHDLNQWFSICERNFLYNKSNKPFRWNKSSSNTILL